MTEPSDHPVTRAAIREAADLVNMLLGSLERPVSVVVDGTSQVVFRRQSAIELSVAKSGRMVSGLGGAIALADAGYLTESACILRVASDLFLEVMSTTEGALKGTPTRDQQEFVNQFFGRPVAAPAPGDPRRSYQSRAVIFKAMDRLVGGVTEDRAEFRRMKDQLDYSLDAYVHGTYATCMALYDPLTGRFMLDGVRSERDRAEMRGYVAAITHQVLIAIGMTALAMNLPRVNERVGVALARLADSHEERYSRDS